MGSKSPTSKPCLVFLLSDLQSKDMMTPVFCWYRLRLRGGFGGCCCNFGKTPGSVSLSEGRVGQNLSSIAVSGSLNRW